MVKIDIIAVAVVRCSDCGATLALYKARKNDYCVCGGLFNILCTFTNRNLFTDIGVMSQCDACYHRFSCMTQRARRVEEHGGKIDGKRKSIPYPGHFERGKKQRKSVIALREKRMAEYSGVAQSVERAAVNRQVDGSKPSTRAKMAVSAKG